MTHPDALRLHLTQIFGDEPEGEMHFLLKGPENQTKIKKFKTIDKAVDYFTKVRDMNCYYCRAYASGGTTGPRISDRDVTEILCYAADIDYKAGDAHSKGAVAPDASKALDLIDALPVPPTFVIHSGHGLQPTWVFKEPVGPDEGRCLLKRIHAYIKTEASALGFSVDNVSDPSRYMRLAGTPNIKKGCEKVWAKFLGGVRHQCNPEDWEQYLPEEEEPACDAVQDAVAITIQSPTEAAESVHELLLDEDENYRRAWNRKTLKNGDGTMSSYDFAIAVAALTSGAPPQIAAELIIMSRSREGADPKNKRKHKGYLTRTITTAKQRVEAEAREAQVQQELEACVQDADSAKEGGEPVLVESDLVAEQVQAKAKKDGNKRVAEAPIRAVNMRPVLHYTDEQRKKNVTAINTVTKMGLKRVLKFIDEKARVATYVLELENGSSVPLEGAANVSKYNTVRNAIIDLANIEPVDLSTSKEKKKQAAAVCKLLISMAYYVDLGAATNIKDATVEAVEDLLERYGVIDEWQEIEVQDDRYGPFLKDDKLYVSATKLVSNMMGETGEAVTKGELGQRLVRVGFEPAPRINFPKSEVEGKRARSPRCLYRTSKEGWSFETRAPVKRVVGEVEED